MFLRNKNPKLGVPVNAIVDLLDLCIEPRKMNLKFYEN